jgi:hypothetical protein
MATENVGNLYDEYRKNQPNPVPAGVHRFEVVGGSRFDGPAGPRANLTATVVGGDLDGQKFFLPGQTLTVNSAGIFFQTFAGFGLGEDFFRSLGNDPVEIVDAVVEACKGVVAEAPFKVEEYQGKVKNEYDGIGVVKFIGRRDAAGVLNEPGAAAPAAPQPPTPEPPAPPAPPQPSQQVPGNGTGDPPPVPAPQPVQTDEDVPF